MKPEFSRLRQKEEEELAQEAQSNLKAEQGRKFESVEEMLRYDNEQNPVPQQLAERVNESIAGEPKPSQSWWKRLFS